MKIVRTSIPKILYSIYGNKMDRFILQATVYCYDSRLHAWIGLNWNQNMLALAKQIYSNVGQ